MPHELIIREEAHLDAKEAFTVITKKNRPGWVNAFSRN